MVTHPEQDETGRVAADVGRDCGAHRRRRHQSEVAHEHPSNQHATDASVAVGERMDHLELGVSDGCLCDRVEVGSIHERDEVVEQLRQSIGRSGDEVCVEWGGATDPSLLVADRADVARWSRAASHERAMPSAELCRGEATAPLGIDERLGHRSKVRGDPRRRRSRASSLDSAITTSTTGAATPSTYDDASPSARRSRRARGR